jgi:hypothetical protein
MSHSMPHHLQRGASAACAPECATSTTSAEERPAEKLLPAEPQTLTRHEDGPAVHLV